MNLSLVMNKRLIIIYNEGIVNTKTYLKGVLKDVENYLVFFKSLEGGSWNDNEIKVFHKPTVAAVKSYIDGVAKCEYFLIVFCGHGGSEEDETILELCQGQDLPLGELCSWVSYTRKLIICDCCRIPPEVEPVMESQNTRVRLFSQGGSIASRIKVRNEYHKAIRATNSRIYTIGFASSLGEAAGETSQGGYYSHSLLKAAAAEANSVGTGVVPFLQCHNLAEPKVIQLSNNEQHPDYMTLRLPNQLPLVVKVKE